MRNASLPLRVLIQDSPLRKPLASVVILGALVLLVLFALVHVALGLGASFVFAFPVFMGALALSVLLGAPTLLLLWYLDRRERESPWLIVSAVLWGMFVAAGLVLFLSPYGFEILARVATDLGLRQTAQSEAQFHVLTAYLNAAVVAPVVEESAKGAALVLLAWLLRSELRGPRDGLIYGALVGLGFNLIEAPTYIVGGYLQSGAAPFVSQLSSRYVFLGANGHALYTALTGIGIGFAVVARRPWQKVLWGVGGLALAMFGHFLHNAFGGIVLSLYAELFGVNVAHPAWWQLWAANAAMTLTLQLYAYCIVVAVIWHTAHTERQIIRAQLAAEMGISVTPQEYAGVLAEPFFGLRKAFHYPPSTARALVTLQNKLALQRGEVIAAGKAVEDDPLVTAYRQQIARLRQPPRSKATRRARSLGAPQAGVRET